MTFDLVDGIYNIARREVKSLTPQWRWMVVTSADPLAIRFDAEDTPLDLVPDSLVSDLSVGDRVLVKIKSGELPIIIGKYGASRYIYAGVPGSTDETAFIVRRMVGGDQMRYAFQAGNSAQANVIVSNQDGYNSILRIGNDGQVAMQTYSDGPTTPATRPLPFATATGSVSIVGNGSNTSTSSVTFPSSRFTSTPVVMATLLSSSTAAAFSLSATAVSTSGCTIRLTRDSGETYSSTYQVSWFAVQMEV